MMKAYLAAVAWTADMRIAKYQDYDTEAEAEAHVAQVAAVFPQAFAAATPSDAWQDWLIDPVARTVAISPAPAPPKPPPSDVEIVSRALLDKGTLTQAEIDAARAKLEA